MGQASKKSIGAIMILGVILAVSCVHEIPEPITENTGGSSNGSTTTVVCSADTVYFAQAVLPLVTSLCGKSGCHGPTNHHEFQLVFSSAEQSYSAIKNRFSTAARLASAVNEMSGENVAGYVAPTSAQLNVIQKCIAQGLKNNSCVACDTTQFTYALAIAPLINSYCVGCHPAPGSSSIPNLSTVTAVQAELANNPGRLMGSIEWTGPYNTSTSRMPQGGAQLPACRITQVKKWINAGALNN
jgi:hypothetical protein